MDIVATDAALESLCVIVGIFAPFLEIKMLTNQKNILIVLLAFSFIGMFAVGTLYVSQTEYQESNRLIIKNTILVTELGDSKKTVKNLGALDRIGTEKNKYIIYYCILFCVIYIILFIIGLLLYFHKKQ